MKADFAFQPGVNTLIGENGSGKTNAFHALRLLLDESLARNAINLRETDFCRELGKLRAHWIVISADLADLDPSDGCQVLRHDSAHMDGSNTGTYTLIFRPKLEVRKKLFELTTEEEGLTEYLDSLTSEHYEPVFTGRSTGDLLDDETYFRWVGSVQHGFPDPEDDDQDILGVKVRSLHQEVACTFVAALRDVVSELRGYRGNPLLALLRGMESDIEISEAERLSGKVQDLNQDISTLEEIESLAAGIQGVLLGAVGHTYGPTISIESALPTSIEKLLQRLTVLVGDSGESAYRGELHEQSLGGANLIYLALKLLEYSRKLAGDRVAHFLLIEEPEAHIHTHVQKALFSNLPVERTQVIVSTHSTHISSASKIRSISVLAKRADHAEVFSPVRGLSEKSVRRAERYLDAFRSTLLFAKGVLLVEGDTEQILVPAFLRKCFGLSPDELGFSVISMGSAFFEHLSIVFSEDRIRRACAIATDGDAPLVALPQDSSTDNARQKRARLAEKRGLNRLARLNKIATGNRWLRVYAARHNFEADFVIAENAREVTATLPDLYRGKPKRAESALKLESRRSDVCGEEAIRIARNAGKGWFALLVSEHVGVETNIPAYLLEAIAFACHLNVNDRQFAQMAQFRVHGFRQCGYEPEGLPPDEELLEMDARDVVAAYRVALPDDDLTRLCEMAERARGVDEAE